MLPVNAHEASGKTDRVDCMLRHWESTSFIFPPIFSSFPNAAAMDGGRKEGTYLLLFLTGPPRLPVQHTKQLSKRLLAGSSLSFQDRPADGLILQDLWACAKVLEPKLFQKLAAMHPGGVHLMTAQIQVEWSPLVQNSSPSLRPCHQKTQQNLHTASLLPPAPSADGMRMEWRMEETKSPC